MLALLLAGTLTGCSALPGGSDDLPDLTEEEAASCARLVDAVPDPLAGEDLTGSDDRTASWGAIELTCGVEEPEAYDEFAACIQVRRVGWFVPDSELEDLTGDATATALTTTPYVALHVPGELRGAGVDQMLAQLAQPMRAALEAGEPCR